MSEKIKYSLIVPCYNEEKNIPLILKRFSELAEKNSHLEVILVDNGSTDHSAQILKTLLPGYSFARSIKVDVNQGYGFGIVSGLYAAQGEVLGWTHADMQTDPMDFLEAFRIYENNPNAQRCFVKGRRYGRPLGDVFFTVGMSIFESFLLGCRLWDINAQPNLFPKTFFDELSDLPKDFSLDLFVYYMAKKKGIKICRFPVNFGKRVHGHSHWNINWKAKMKFIKRTIDFSFNLKRRLTT